MAIWRSLDPGWGMAAVRVVMGLILVTAGWGKVASGLPTVASNFAKMGMPVPGVTGPFIALLELVGGALLLVGLGGRWVGLLFAIEFVVAAFVVKLPNAGWAGARLDLMLLAGGVLLLFAVLAIVQPTTPAALRLLPGWESGRALGVMVLGMLALGQMLDSLTSLMGLGERGSMVIVRRVLETAVGPDLFGAVGVFGIIAAAAEELFF